MRSKLVQINEKEILVTEKRIKELKDLSEKISVDVKSFLNVEADNKATNDIVTNIVDILEDKMLIIFPTLTQDDLDNAYPSEIENLITTFLEVNFTGAKKVITQVMKLK